MGEWDFEPAPVTVTEKVTIIHNFESGTADKSLPVEIVNMIPKAYDEEKGATVSPINPSVKTVEVADGTWTFAGFDKTAVKAETDVLFTGVWTFTAKGSTDPVPNPPVSNPPAINNAQPVSLKTGNDSWWYAILYWITSLFS